MFLSAGLRKSFILTTALIGLGIVLSSCQNGIAFAQPAASKTLPVVPSLTATPQPPTITATASRTPTATLTRTPPALPSPLAAKELKKGVQPYTYIPNTCEYLKNRWDPNKSQPGTVVMPVMYHSITEDYTPLAADGSQIHHSDLEMFVKHAREVGFTTITTRQLVDFLENNAKIPLYSMILIVDDRRPGVVKEHFWPFLEDFHWTLTLAWPIADTDQKPATWLKGENYTSLWQQMEAYNASGMLDIQSHGYVHNIPIDDYSTDEFINHEIIDSRKPLQDHFYCKDYQTGQPIANCQTDQPLAYIWPGGGFSAHAAQIAQEAGYKIGFTTNPRGPVMYNWVPLASQVDLSSPTMLVEAGVNNPLMVLPRYWSSDAAYRIDDVYHVSQEAVKAAQQTKATELDYYNIVCLNKTGPIPTLQP